MGLAPLQKWPQRPLLSLLKGEDSMPRLPLWTRKQPLWDIRHESVLILYFPVSRTMRSTCLLFGTQNMDFCYSSLSSQKRDIQLEYKILLLENEDYQIEEFGCSSEEEQVLSMWEAWVPSAIHTRGIIRVREYSNNISSLCRREN